MAIWTCETLEVASSAVEQLRLRLDEELARVRVRCPRAQGALSEGVPWRGILDVADARGADLVVLSTHGRHGLQHAFLGSVAAKIVRMSPVPVVTVGGKLG